MTTTAPVRLLVCVGPNCDAEGRGEFARDEVMQGTGGRESAGTQKGDVSLIHDDGGAWCAREAAYNLALPVGLEQGEPVRDVGAGRGGHPAPEVEAEHARLRKQDVRMGDRVQGHHPQQRGGFWRLAQRSGSRQPHEGAALPAAWADMGLAGRPSQGSIAARAAGESGAVAL